MKEFNEEDIEKQLLKLGSNLNQLESLSRILLECIRNNENLKFYDVENLAYILNKNIKKVNKRFNFIETELNL